jgi:hypothetical protein
MSGDQQSRAGRVASTVWGYVVLAAFASAAVFVLWISATKGLLALGLLPLAVLAVIVFLVVRAARRH